MCRRKCTCARIGCLRTSESTTFTDLSGACPAQCTAASVARSRSRVTDECSTSLVRWLPAATLRVHLSLASACCTVLGTIMQRCSLEAICHTCFTLCMLWKIRLVTLSASIRWVGLSGVVFAGLGDFAALGLASQPLVASLGGSTTLIANVFVARFYNKNALYATDLLGVACVAAGNAPVATNILPANRPSWLSHCVCITRSNLLCN